MLTVLLFIVILGILVLAHEGGHFLAAKLNGVRVHEFGFGFPPRLWARRHGETEYSVNLLPLGGFVRIAGEDGRDEGTERGRSFSEKRFLVKFTMLGAGVAVNWMIAAFLLGTLQIFGAPIAVSDAENIAANVTVSAVAPASPAASAGLLAGDTIIGLAAEDGSAVPATIREVQKFLSIHAGKEVRLTLRRGEDEPRTLSAVPRTQPPEGEGPLGVALVRVAKVSHPWYEAPFRGVFVAASLSIAVVQGLGDMVGSLLADGRLAEGITGPVGIAVATGQVQTLGFGALLAFIAVLSLNLAVLNAIPFPALDGGRVAIAALEGLFRRPFPLRVVAWFHAAGFTALMAIVLLITYRDVRNLL